jgi:glycosyltransferase involved in cell wall biosynthesis
MTDFARLWPGEVTLAVPRRPRESTPAAALGAVEQGDLPFGVREAATWAEAVEQARPDLLVAPLVPRLTELAQWVSRSVLVAEFSPEELTRTELAGPGGAARRARVLVGGRRRRRLYESLVREAQGVQCNGHPAHDRFDPLARSSLLFFDTRLTREHVRLARAAGRTAPGRRPARLCFSGRLVPGKGPVHALDATRLLRSRGWDATLTILGHGELQERLAASAGDGIRLAGSLPFASEWTRYVREEVDLLVLPHLQGDPSGTYLEAAGCGVPVVGYDNVALRSLESRHGVGASVPVGDVTALAGLMADVLADDRRWAALRDRGLGFMEDHPYESEMAARVAHLVDVHGTARR